MIKNGVLSLTLNYKTLGDPGKGEQKKLVITYEIDGKRVTETYWDNSKLNLGRATTIKPADKPSVPEPVSIDVSVPATIPAATTQAASAAPVDPDAIERPEYRTTPKALVKSITSITAMVVRIADDGEETGFTTDIIAAVNAQSRKGDTAGAGFYRVDGDEAMKMAFEEAVRAVTVRYPLWEPGHIDVSFGEKARAHGGPSAGTAFALLMLSTLEGFDIDPQCAVTGDISVDWKVRKIGGVVAKVRGAAMDKCLYAAIPQSNESAIADMAILYGHSSLWDIQTFSIATLQEAEAVAQKNRAPKLTEAMKLFADLQPQLTADEKGTLKNPETRATLAHILELAPNHLSAKNLLAIIDGTNPKTLSAAATAYKIGVILYPYRDLMSVDAIKGVTIPEGLPAVTVKRQLALRPIANKELMPLLNDVSAFIDTANAIANHSAQPSALKAKVEAVAVRLSTVSSDPDFVGNLARDGY
jgi:hypothetical protein